MISIETLSVCAVSLRHALDPSGVVPDAEVLVEFLRELDAAGFTISEKQPTQQLENQLPYPGAAMALPLPPFATGLLPDVQATTSAPIATVDEIPF